MVNSKFVFFPNCFFGCGIVGLKSETHCVATRYDKVSAFLNLCYRNDSVDVSQFTFLKL